MIVHQLWEVMWSLSGRMMRQKCSRYVHIVYVLYLVSCTESLILRQIHVDGEPDVIGVGKYIIKSIWWSHTVWGGGGNWVSSGKSQGTSPSRKHYTRKVIIIMCNEPSLVSTQSVLLQKFCCNIASVLSHHKFYCPIADASHAVRSAKHHCDNNSSYKLSIWSWHWSFSSA